MPKATTIPTNESFTLQWHVTGAAGGQWNGALAGAPPYQSLDKWSLEGGEHTFVFTVKQGQGQPITEMYVMLEGKWEGKRVAYGGQWRSNVAGDPMGTISIDGPITVTAGRLISGDPKIQLSNDSNTPPTANMNWDGREWIVTDGEGNPMTPTPGTDIYILYAGGSSDARVFITDQTASPGSPSECAMYRFRDDDVVGELYDGSENPQTLTRSTDVADFNFPRAEIGRTYTVNLFASEQTNSSDQIPPSS